MNDNDQERWYAVNLLYESVHTGERKNIDENYTNDEKVYEENHILVRTTSCEEACQLGEQMGREKELQYKNVYDETVRWVLVKVLDCFELLDDELQVGTEVYSRYIIVPKEESTEEVIERLFPE